MQAVLPDPKFRSPTADPSQSNLRDFNVYSAIVVAHGGNGTQHAFAGASGTAIPALSGSTATANKWQTLYSDLTTNLNQQGVLGSLGDGSIRAIGITLESAAYTPSGASAGAATAWGATQQEVADTLSKLSFELKIANTREIIGPMFNFPGFGGVGGGIASTGNAAVTAMASNGQLGSGRRLKYPIAVARTDTLDGVFQTGNGSSLAFSVTTGAGQPCLCWVSLFFTMGQDVR